MFGRHFLAYGVRIALGVDCPALLDRFVHGYLPFGWRPVEDHEPEAAASVQYLLLADEAEPSYRLYAGIQDYDGRDPNLDRRVAIKTILTRQMDPKEQKDVTMRFERAW